MEVRDLIALLEQENPSATVQEVFGKPALSSAREAIKSIRPAREHPAGWQLKLYSNVEPVELDRLEVLLTLSAKWAADPQAFFDSWRIDDHAAVDETATASSPAPTSAMYTGSPGTDNSRWCLRQKIKLMRQLKAQQVEDSMRQILCAVFFHDVVIAKSSRRKEDSGLPTGGLPNLVSQAWTQLTGDELDDETAKEVTGYVKAGYRYHLVGQVVGPGAWLLLSAQVTNVWSKYPVRSLIASKSTHDACTPVKGLEIASKAANHIREFQMRPFAVSPSKRKSSECLYAKKPPKRLMASNTPNTRASTFLPAGYVQHPARTSASSASEVCQHTKKTPEKRTTNTTTSANLTEEETEPPRAPCGASSSEPRALGAARPTGATAQAEGSGIGVTGRHRHSAEATGGGTSFPLHSLSAVYPQPGVDLPLPSSTDSDPTPALTVDVCPGTSGVLASTIGCYCAALDRFCAGHGTVPDCASTQHPNASPHATPPSVLSLASTSHQNEYMPGGLLPDQRAPPCVFTNASSIAGVWDLQDRAVFGFQATC